MRLVCFIILLPALTLLIGCETFRHGQSESTVMGQANAPSLLAPALLNRSLQVNQQVQFEQAGTTRQLLVVWSQSQGVLQLVGLSVQGQRLFSLKLEGQLYSEQAYVPLPAGFSPRRLLQELQWAYWPAADVARSLFDVGLRLNQTSNMRDISGADGFNVRYLFQDDNFPQSLTLIHNQGYELHIRTLSVLPIEPVLSSEDSQ